MQQNQNIGQKPQLRRPPEHMEFFHKLSNSENPWVRGIAFITSSGLWEARHYLTRGKRALSEGKSEHAVEYLTLSIEAYPAPGAYLLRGDAYLQSGEFQKAADDYTVVIRLEPSSIMAYEGRRKAREGAGNADGAIADKIRVNDLRNTTTDISKERMMKEYLQTGTQNLSKEDLETAIEDFGMALAFKPNSPAAYFGIGTALLELEDYEGAIHNFSKAIKFGMKDAQVFHSRGLSNYHLGNLQQAIADQTRAIKRDPSLESAHYCRGRAYHDSGKFRAAIRDYDTTLKLAPHNTVVYYYRGQAKRDLGDYKSAIQDFTLLIESDPTCAEYYSQRAQTMYRWAMSKSKIADQLELIADIGAPERQKWLSKERVSRLEAALADSDKAILLEPSAEASYNRSLVNFRLNRLDAALADCKTAVGLEPDFADAWHNLGCVMYKLGSMQYSDTLLKEAMAAFDNAIKYKETLAGAYYLRSKLREKFGDEKGAQEDTMQALTRKILGDAGWDDASVADVLRGRRA